MADPILEGCEIVLKPAMALLGVEIVLEKLLADDGRRGGFQGAAGVRAQPDFGYDPAEG